MGGDGDVAGSASGHMLPAQARPAPASRTADPASATHLCTVSPGVTPRDGLCGNRVAPGWQKAVLIGEDDKRVGTF